MHLLHLFFSIFGEFQAPPIAVEYDLQCIEPFTMDLSGRKYSWSDAEENGGGNDRCGMCEHDLSNPHEGWLDQRATSGPTDFETQSSQVFLTTL